MVGVWDVPGLFCVVACSGSLCSRLPTHPARLETHRLFCDQHSRPTVCSRHLRGCWALLPGRISAGVAVVVGSSRPSLVAAPCMTPCVWRM